METTLANSVSIRLDSLRDLLDCLAEPLRDARKSKVSENQHCASSFSARVYFDKNNKETKQTEIIASLLNPLGKHGQGILFLRHLLAMAWSSTEADGWNEQDLQHATVFPNHYIENGINAIKRHRFIDLWVQVGSSHILAIESKAKGAADQLGQITDYLGYMKRACSASGKYKLLYLSPDGCQPCAKSISPQGWKSACDADVAEVHDYASFVRDWLTICKDNCEADRVKFFIEDLLTFIDPNDRRTVAMPREIDPAISELLLHVHPKDPISEVRRETLLAIWEISDQISVEVITVFQNNLYKQFAERQIEYEPNNDDGLLKAEWGSIKGPKSEFIVDGKPQVAYTEIQRCQELPPSWHGTSEPHFVIGIKIENLEDTEELKRWREHASSVLGAGTGDRKWTWQQIPLGFEDLHSKETAIRLLDPQSADDIIDRMQDVLKMFVESMQDLKQ
jgi:hypothetical protein